MIYVVGRHIEDNRRQIVAALTQEDVNLMVREQVLHVDLKSHGVDAHLMLFYKPTHKEIEAILQSAQPSALKLGASDVQDGAKAVDSVEAQVIPAAAAPEAPDAAADGEVRP